MIEFATAHARAVLTLNRWQFIGHHARNLRHAGIVVCTVDSDSQGQATRIHEAIRELKTLESALIRVNRPPRP